MDSAKNVVWQKVSQASPISHALWPRELRRSPAVDERMQQEGRRSLSPSDAAWWRRSLGALERAHFFYTCVMVAGGLASITALIVLVYGWPVDLVFFCVSSLAAAVTFFFMMRDQRAIRPKEPVVMMPGLVQATPRLALGADPETPLPATPLVRVLETIDLSTCPVEHFWDVPDTLVPQQESASMPPHP